MFRYITLILIVLLLLIGGYDRSNARSELTQHEPTNPAVKTPVVLAETILLKDLVELHRYEFASQALQEGYACRGSRPARRGLYRHSAWRPFLPSAPPG
jgi:hypothetical protein